MVRGFDLQKSLLDQIDKWRTELAHPVSNRPVGLAKQIGAIMVKESQRSFQLQRLGDIEWPKRYPGMQPPVINIAGALSDFISGRNAPKPNRFQNRPAVVDEGMRGGLWGSISFRVTDDLTVNVGSNKQHARLHQEGGVSVQSYGEDTKDRIRNWLFKKRYKALPLTKKTAVPRSGREGYVAKLAPLLLKNNHVTRVIARPFVGVTDNGEKEIRQSIERYFARFKP